MMFAASFFLIFALAAPIRVAAAPLSRRGASPEIQKANGLAAQEQNKRFLTLTVDSECKPGEQACIKGQYAQCAPEASGQGKWALTPCGASTTCIALPLINSKGTSLSCDTIQDAELRFQASGVEGGIAGEGSSAPTGTDAEPDNEEEGDEDDDDECIPEDDEDDEEYEEEPAVSTSTSVSATSTIISSATQPPATIINLSVPVQKRQVLTVPASSASSTASSTGASSTASASPSSSASASSTTELSDPIAIQTAIGADGLKTVTVRETVTVFMVPLSTSGVEPTGSTDAGSSPAPSVSSTAKASATETASVSASGEGTVPASTGSPSASSTSASRTASASASGSASASSSGVPSSSSAESASAETPSSTPASPFTIRTAAPAPTVNNNQGPVPSLDLTATIPGPSPA